MRGLPRGWQSNSATPPPNLRELAQRFTRSRETPSRYWADRAPQAGEERGDRARNRTPGYYRSTSDGVVLSERFDTFDDAFRSRLDGEAADVRTRLLVELRQHDAAWSELKLIEIGIGYGVPVPTDHYLATAVAERASWLDLGVLAELANRAGIPSLPSFRDGRFMKFPDSTAACFRLIRDRSGDLE